MGRQGEPNKAKGTGDRCKDGTFGCAHRSAMNLACKLASADEESGYDRYLPAVSNNHIGEMYIRICYGAAAHHYSARCCIHKHRKVMCMLSHMVMKAVKLTAPLWMSQAGNHIHANIPGARRTPCGTWPPYACS